MEIRVYAMHIVGGGPLDPYASPSYSDLIHAHRRVIEHLMRKGYEHVESGSIEIIPSKGVPLRIRETLASRNVLVEAYVHADIEKRRTLLDMGIATIPNNLERIISMINYASILKFKLCPGSEIWAKRDLELFKELYRNLLLRCEESSPVKTIVTENKLISVLKYSEKHK
ncbi:MAG: hypothetical protein Q8N99_03200 [Nanoarchaeota archaeon]|nr:hypothetical protein [Nanoarchaeota archaeon]